MSQKILVRSKFKQRRLSVVCIIKLVVFFSALQQKIAEQQDMQVEIDRINQEHQRQKELRNEQEKLADQKVIEYMKKKAVSAGTNLFVD